MIFQTRATTRIASMHALVSLADGSGFSTGKSQTPGHRTGWKPISLAEGWTQTGWTIPPNCRSGLAMGPALQTNLTGPGHWYSASPGMARVSLPHQTKYTLAKSEPIRSAATVAIALSLWTRVAARLKVNFRRFG